MKTTLLGSCAALALYAGTAAAQPSLGYVPGSLAESQIVGGPWTLHQAGPGGHDASGIVPVTPGPPYPTSGTPYAGYCVGGQPAVSAGLNPMQPFYFPFAAKVTTPSGNYIIGLFDYRPRNEEERTVQATSYDGGRSWVFAGSGLGLNPNCPADPTDPDNLNVLLGSTPVPYGSSSANAGDNGLGHAFATVFGRSIYLYNLDRASGHIDADQLVVHTLPNGSAGSQPLPDLGYVSPFAARGYPAKTPPLQTTQGLVNPDAILGNVPVGGSNAFFYVAKVLNGDSALPACPSTPAFALTTLVTGKPRKANHDLTLLRVATTTDGLNFTDAGVATGLADNATTALNGTRYVGSGGLIPLANGHYGLLFSGGSCLDNDSDGFHYIGYAETVNAVTTAADLLSWRTIYGFDNPILSTDTVTDPAGRAYPLNPPLVTDGVDLLTAQQVAPFVPPAGHNANFFSGRAYGPQPVITAPNRVTVVFAGYNTPQPSSNLGDYRTIGRFELQFPDGYLSQTN